MGAGLIPNGRDTGKQREGLAGRVRLEPRLRQLRAGPPQMGRAGRLQKVRARVVHRVLRVVGRAVGSALLQRGVRGGLRPPAGGPATGPGGPEFLTRAGRVLPAMTRRGSRGAQKVRTSLMLFCPVGSMTSRSIPPVGGARGRGRRRRSSRLAGPRRPRPPRSPAVSWAVLAGLVPVTSTDWGRQRSSAASR